MKKVSIIVPFHWAPGWERLLERCLKSIETQTFTDYEIILLKYGRAAETQNRLMQVAQGELIKILHADDFFTYPEALQQIVNHFGELDYWQASGCFHSDDFSEPFYPHLARYSPDIHTGNNTIGAPSVLTFRNDPGVTFDPTLDWLYDVAFYKQFFDRYGPPTLLDEYPVTIGLHSAQLTHTITESQKLSEVELMRNKYVL